MPRRSSAWCRDSRHGRPVARLDADQLALRPRESLYPALARARPGSGCPELSLRQRAPATRLRPPFRDIAQAPSRQSYYPDCDKDPDYDELARSSCHESRCTPENNGAYPIARVPPLGLVHRPGRGPGRRRCRQAGKGAGSLHRAAEHDRPVPIPIPQLRGEQDLDDYRDPRYRQVRWFELLQLTGKTPASRGCGGAEWR